MPIVTITLNDRNFKLSCPEESKEQLISLAEKLDIQLTKMKNANPSASFELLLVMVALSLQEEKQSNTPKNEQQILKEANEEFQSILSLIYSELKIVTGKLE